MGRLNPLSKFSLLSLFFVLILIISLSLTGSYLFKEVILYREGKVTADFVTTAFNTHFSLSRPFSSREDGFKDFATHNLLNVPGLKNVRIYNSDGYILWSNDPKLIGKRSRDLFSRIGNRARASLVSLDTPYSQEPSLNIYIPIFDKVSSDPAEIIAISKDPSDLIKIIREGHIIIWIVSFIGGLFLYLSLFSVFYKAYRMEKRMTEGIVRLNKELTAFNKIAVAVSKSIELETLLKDALESTLEALNMEAGWILLVDEESGSLRLAAHKGISEDMLKALKENIKEGIAGQVAKTGRLVMRAELSDYPGLREVEGDIESCASIPLKAMGKILGVMEIMCPSCACKFPLESPELFSAIGHQIGAAISKSLLYKEVMTLKEDLERMVEEKTRQVIQMEKLSTLGELMGAIAHQLNNPLVGVVNFSQYILGKLEKDHPLREDMETILQAGTECKEIIERLLAFSRQASFERSRADLNNLLDECLRLTERQFDLKGIRLERDYAPSAQVSLDVTLMRQALLNIIINAIQAMEEGGRLSIATRTDGVGWVEVEIADTGKGIDEGAVSKIFDPFFTTKKGGLGLGLTVVRDIIHRHGGEIKVRSKKGEGTTFTIRLPAGSGKDHEETNGSDSR